MFSLNGPLKFIQMVQGAWSWFGSHSHTHPKTRPTRNDLHSWSKITSSNTIATVVLTLINDFK